MFDWYQDAILHLAGRVARAAASQMRFAWRSVRGLFGRPGLALASTINTALDTARRGVLRVISQALPTVVTQVAKVTARAIRGAVLAAPTLEDIHRIVFANPWSMRLVRAIRAPGAVLAAAIAADPASAEEIARRPFEVATNTVSRVAAAESVRVAHQAQFETWEQLGDVIVGYQINAVRDNATRPAHFQRHGTIYYRDPQPGQLGFNQMPHPPREADGTIAHNCRCFLTPVFSKTSGITVRASG